MFVDIGMHDCRIVTNTRLVYIDYYHYAILLKLIILYTFLKNRLPDLFLDVVNTCAKSMQNLGKMY